MSHLSKKFNQIYKNLLRKLVLYRFALTQEGAQIRTKVKKEKFIKSGKILIINDIYKKLSFVSRVYSRKNKIERFTRYRI